MMKSSQEVAFQKSIINQTQPVMDDQYLLQTSKTLAKGQSNVPTNNNSTLNNNLLGAGGVSTQDGSMQNSLIKLEQDMQYNQGSSQMEAHDADKTDAKVEEFFKKYGNRAEAEPTLGDNQ